MPSNHLILCRPLLLLSSIFPSIRVYSNESVLCIRWPEYWSFSIHYDIFNKENVSRVEHLLCTVSLKLINMNIKNLTQGPQELNVAITCLHLGIFFLLSLSVPYRCQCSLRSFSPTILSALQVLISTFHKPHSCLLFHMLSQSWHMVIKIFLLLFSRRDHFSIMMQNLCNVIIGRWDCMSADQEDLWKRHEIINSQSHLPVLACSREKKMQMVAKEHVGDGG